MTTAYCGIGDCKAELAPGKVGNCGKHPVNDAWKTFWDMWLVDLDKIPECDKLKEALLESFRVAAGLRKSQEGRKP